MRKQVLAKLAAGMLCGAMTLVSLTACRQKQVTLESQDLSDQLAEQIIGTAGGMVNFTLPEIGEEIVVMTVRDYGDIKIRLFPEESETGVENFKQLVQSGFYDELIFHRVADGFVIQGGDPKGNGSGGVDAWGSEEGFAQTISDHLCHVTGAVAYATGEDRRNTSQFYIVTGEELTSDYFTQLRDYNGVTFTPELEALYQKFGGQPYLDGSYEIFGQVFDGLEYCLAIQKVPVNGDEKPKSAVMIEKAVVTEYDGAAPHWRNAAGEEITVDSSD